MDRMIESENMEGPEFSIIKLILPWPSGLTFVTYHSFFVVLILVFLSFDGFFMYAVSAPLSLQYSVITPCFFRAASVWF
jgi:hypothetical protein